MSILAISRPIREPLPSSYYQCIRCGILREGARNKMGHFCVDCKPYARDYQETR